MAGNFTPGTGADFHYRGTTDGGAPSTGSFTVGDWVETPTGISVCQLGGSPGTWADQAASGSVSDAAYDSTAWNGDTTHAPSKNAVRDKIEALVIGGGGAIAVNEEGAPVVAAATTLNFVGPATTVTDGGSNTAVVTTAIDELIDDRVADLLIAGTNITLTYADNGAGVGTLTIDAAGGSADKLGLTPTAVKTTNYSAAAGDFVPVDTTSGAVTVTLPTAPADKTVIAVKHIIQGGTNAVTIACGGSDVFNKAGGATSGSLSLLAQAMLLQYRATGAIWYVVADDLPLGSLDLRFAPITGIPESAVTNLTSDLAAKAPLASPALTGTPTAPSAAQGTNTTQLATTAYVQTEVGLLVPKSLVDAKGDLLVATADNVVARLGVGSDGQVLTADAASTPGVKWAAPAAGGGSVATDPIWDAAGDLAVGSGADTAAKLSKGSALQVLRVNAGATALEWAAAAGAVATDAIFDAKGDLPVGTGADTASKLAVGANGTVLVADSTQSTGLKYTSGRSYLVDEVHADAGSASSTAEQTLATLVLLGGAAAAGDILRFTAMGDYLQNSGGAINYTWKFKIGTTTVLTTSVAAVVSGANRSKWWVDLQIAVASTSAQRVGGILTSSLSANGTATWAPLSGGPSPAMSGIGYGTAAEDLTANANFILTCQLGTSNGSADVILHAASLTLIKK